MRVFPKANSHVLVKREQETSCMESIVNKEFHHGTWDAISTRDLLNHPTMFRDTELVSMHNLKYEKLLRTRTLRTKKQNTTAPHSIRLNNTIPNLSVQFLVHSRNYLDKILVHTAN